VIIARNLLIDMPDPRLSGIHAEQHLGFEFSAWYWHFVDVVWLFLFACIYVWGAGAGHAAGGPLPAGTDDGGCPRVATLLVGRDRVGDERQPSL